MFRSILARFYTILQIIAGYCPKDSRLVLFGAMNGIYYGDNARHLFEWIHQNEVGIDAVWITKSRAVFHQLQAAGLPVALGLSWKGFWLLCRAKTAVFTNSMNDFSANPAAVPATIRLLALRHGRSVKRVRFARQEHKVSAREAHERTKEGRLIQYAISTSEFVSDLQEECLRIGRHKHVVTGYPRNDYLFLAPKEPPLALHELLSGGKKAILYGPSWRHGREPTRFFPFSDFDREQLVTFLRQHNYLLLLRPHVNDLRKYPATRQFLEELAQMGDCIRLASHDIVPDVNVLLPYVDTLISDYSALYHDFLLLDRPILLIPYDYQEFERQNGFLYDYYANLPGPAIESFEQFCHYLEQLKSGEDPHHLQRRRLRDKIHYYQDGDACSRVAELLRQCILDSGTKS